MKLIILITGVVNSGKQGIADFLEQNLKRDDIISTSVTMLQHYIYNLDIDENGVETPQPNTIILTAYPSLTDTWLEDIQKICKEEHYSLMMISAIQSDSSIENYTDFKEVKKQTLDLCQFIGKQSLTYPNKTIE